LNGTLKNIKKRKSLLFLIGFYVLHIIGFFYSEDKQSAAFDLEIKLSIFFIPLGFLISKIDFKNQYNKAFKWFIYGLLLSTLINVFNSVYHYVLSSDVKDLFYVNASVFHHTSYYGLYLIFGILILYFRSFKPNHHFNIKPGWIILLNIWFTGFIFLLTSKTALITVFLIHICALVYLAFKYNKKTMALIFIFLLTTAPIIAYFTSYTFKVRIDEFYEVLMNDTYNLESTSMTRIQVWKSSIEIIKNIPVYGLGTGDVLPALKNAYQQHGYQHALDLNLNPHNQYLQTTLALGLIGGLYLLLMLGYFFRLGLKHKNLLFSFFILVVFMNMLTESMLETQSGVVFISFFIAFFLSFINKNEEI
jgi:O-antigen ligase